MRCEFELTESTLPGKLVSFQCKACGKKMSIPAVIKDKFSLLTQKLPDCAAGGPPTAAMTAPPAVEVVPISQMNLAGPGTQLKRLLSKVGIKATPNCSCNARARKMDEMGIEWCEQNIDEIVGWLKEEAGKRKLPFLSFPTKVLVQRAIKLAKRARDEKQAAEETATTETTEQ